MKSQPPQRREAVPQSSNSGHKQEACFRRLLCSNVWKESGHDLAGQPGRGVEARSGVVCGEAVSQVDKSKDCSMPALHPPLRSPRSTRLSGIPSGSGGPRPRPTPAC